jgi:hypothetical protein
MDIITILQKLALVLKRTNEILDAYGDRILTEDKNRLIDEATIVLMQYQDHFFHFAQLRNIVSDRLNKKLAGAPEWFIDVTHSTSDNLVVRSANGQQLSLPIDACMMMTQLAVN